MAALGTYTTTQAVRGCMGVDANDCPDATMVDSKLDLELSLDLDTWLATHAALYAAGIAGGATAAETAISNRITLYAQWFCALEMINRQLLVPQINTDGKAQMDRFKVDLNLLAEKAAAKVGKYKGELVELVDGTTPTSAYSDFVSVAVPGTDVITETIQ